MLHHDLQSLRIFLTACEMRSMSKAAEHLNLALSAASRRVSILEQEVGAPLIVRRSHGIEPTAAGVTVMNYARDVLRLGEKLRRREQFWAPYHAALRRLPPGDAGGLGWPARVSQRASAWRCT